MSHRKIRGPDTADKHAQALREIQAACPENRKCFECEQRGPTYINMTVGAFVCTKCSGMLRGINPPHRIKSISMSSFTSDEVEFVRNKGNVYCAKVWLGLYDKSHGFMVDLKDDDAIRDCIIQKYEKKRYYVDPSTIRHSLGSTASTNSSENSDGASSSIVKRPSGMIGTTIQLHSNKFKQPTNPSADTAGHKVASSSFLPAPPPSASQPVPKVKTSTSSPGAASLAAFAVPAPAVDPFASTSSKLSDKPSSSTLESTFGDFAASFPPVSAQAPAKIQTAAAPAQPNGGGGFGGDNFADFESANFGGAPLQNPLSQPAQSTGASKTMQAAMSSSNTNGSAPAESRCDRYAALKDLDEIFKTAVVKGDSPASTGGTSTGASIFGNSPMAASSFASPPPGAATSRAPTSPMMNTPHNLGVGQGSFAGSSSVANNSWTPTWPSLSSPSVANNHRDGAADLSNQMSSRAPINPFTVNSNLTQLNTSPWPTTGASPEQSMGGPSWSSAGVKKSSIVDNQFGATRTNGSRGAASASLFPDPFGAAPSGSAVSQQSDPIDLFAKAPKPLMANCSGASEPFSNDLFANTSQFNAESKVDQFAGDPWASIATVSKQDKGEELFTSAMKPAANPNNPFL